MLRGIFIRAFLVIAVPVALLRPVTGLMLYLFYSHVRMNDFVWPQYQVMNGALALAIATIVGYFVLEVRRSPLHFRGLKLIVVFWCWIALACLFAVNRELAMPKLSQFTNIFVITFLVAAVCNTDQRVKQFLYVLAFSIGLLGAKGAFDFIITGGQATMQGPGGLIVEQNEYALALNMGIPLLFVLAKYQPRKWLRIAMWAMGVGCGIVVIGTHSRSGLLGLAAAALLLTFYSKKKALGLTSLALAGILFVLVAPEAALDRYKTIPNAAETDASAIGRLQAWQTALEMTKAHPLLGVGPLNFETEFSKYSAYHARAPHNAFIGLMAESGIPSMLLFIAIVGSAIGQMWKLRRRLLLYADNELLASYCLAIQLTLMVYIVPNCFINRQNQDMMYHLIGISAGLAIVAKRRLAAQRAERRAQLSPVAMAAWEPANV